MNLDIHTAKTLTMIAEAILRAEKEAESGELYVSEVRFRIADADFEFRLTTNDFETLSIEQVAE